MDRDFTMEGGTRDGPGSGWGAGGAGAKVAATIVTTLTSKETTISMTITTPDTTTAGTTTVGTTTQTTPAPELASFIPGYTGPGHAQAAVAAGQDLLRAVARDDASASGWDLGVLYDWMASLSVAGVIENVGHPSVRGTTLPVTYVPSATLRLFDARERKLLRELLSGA